MLDVPSDLSAKAELMIDEDPDTWWGTETKEVVIDLSKVHELKGFTYLPMQDRWIKGVITHYEFFVSEDNRRWKKQQQVSSGIFGTILLNRKLISNSPRLGYIKLVAAKIQGEGKEAALGEVGVITQ